RCPVFVDHDHRGWPGCSAMPTHRSGPGALTRRRILTAAAATAAWTATGAANTPAAADPRPTHGLLINLREYGAVGDGVTDDTEVFNAALDDVERNGGGTIYFPPGTYPVGNSARPRLRNNLTLVGKDATLLKSGPNGA